MLCEITERGLKSQVYLAGSPASTEYTGKLQQAVGNVLLRKEWRRDYMLYALRLQEEHNAGWTEGRKEGKAETKELFAKVFAVIRENPGMDDKEVAQKCNCPESEVEDIRNIFGM